VKDHIEIAVALIGCLIGVGGAAAAIYARWKASIEKGYAAQRDFQHLKRNQEQISAGIAEIAKDFDQGLTDISKDVDNRFDRTDLALNRMEGMILTLLAKGSYRPDDEKRGWHGNPKE
jgi:shikimate 5-dehydrogenase